MNIHFKTLSLLCKESREVIDLDYQVVFFHGKVGSGKSSIPRLINFCLGGSLEKTPAITREVINVSLELNVGEYQVLLERDLHSDSHINATCVDKEGHSFTLSVPVAGATAPVLADTVYNMSDLIFYLLDIQVLRIPANKKKEDANLVRLSIRNFMWYCYLDQSKLDNSFFRHEDSTKTRNSKEVLKYILQYSTQKLIELEARLQEYRTHRFTNLATASGLRDFLKKFGFSTDKEIDKIIAETSKKLIAVNEERRILEGGYSQQTHSSDQLRDKIRDLIISIQIKEQANLDLADRINEQETLRSELVSAKFKLTRSSTIANVFQGVDFKNCPSCGSGLPKPIDENHCGLCGNEVGAEKPTAVEQAEVVQKDLSDRIRELEDSIDLHKKAWRKLKRELDNQKQRRAAFDEELGRELKQYESIFLSNIRNLDKRSATLQERMKSLERLKRMPQEITRLEEDAADTLKKEQLLKTQIIAEKQTLVKGETMIQELEEIFLTSLLEIGMPGVSTDDKVVINRKTWEVMIWPKGEDYLKWNFYNAGSGGKKTLFNSCFLLSLHILSSKYDLPLPTFIIIDTPMKNIDREVNQDTFRNFYKYLYTLAAGVLDNTQFIITDNNHISPAAEIKLSVFDRYMAADDPSNPPLIRYYVGP